MKNLKKLLYKYFGELITVIGSGILSYNIFNFDYIGRFEIVRQTDVGSFKRITTEPSLEFRYEYYDETLLWIAVGTILLVLGILIIKLKKK